MKTLKMMEIQTIHHWYKKGLLSSGEYKEHMQRWLSKWNKIEKEQDLKLKAETQALGRELDEIAYDLLYGDEMRSVIGYPGQEELV